MRAPYGPSLPEAVRERFGVPLRTTLIATAIGLMLLGLVVFAVLRLTAKPQLVHEGTPVFNLVYDDAVIREARPRGAELARLEASRRGLRVSIVALPLKLPAYEGNVARGLLPVYAERHMAPLRASLPGFRIRDEGRGNTNGSPGYQVGYASQSGTARVSWRDTLIVPDDPSPRSGVVTRLRIESRDGRLNAADEKVVTAMREAYDTFTFGSARA